MIQPGAVCASGVSDQELVITVDYFAVVIRNKPEVGVVNVPEEVTTYG